MVGGGSKVAVGSAALVAAVEVGTATAVPVTAAGSPGMGVGASVGGKSGSPLQAAKVSKVVNKIVQSICLNIIASYGGKF
jgi:hypothetical protein